MSKEVKDDSYSHILKYTGLFGGVQGLNILMSIVRGKLTALLLGPAGMGLVALFNATIQFISNATNLGLPTSAVKNVSEAYDGGDEKKLRSAISLIRSWSLLTAIIGTLLFVLLSSLFNGFSFSKEDYTLHFIFLSLVVGLMAITGGEMAILKGTRKLRCLARSKPKSFLFIEIVTKSLFALCVIGGYMLGGLTGAGAGLAVNGVLNLIVSYLFFHFKFAYKLSRNSILYSALQMPIGCITALTCFCLEGWAYWVAGCMLVILSLVLSLFILLRKMGHENEMAKKILQRLHLGRE